MRLRGLCLASLLAVPGCGYLTEPPAGEPTPRTGVSANAPAPVASAPAPGGGSVPVDPLTLAEQLGTAQPGWRSWFNRFMPRRVDCRHIRCVALTFDDGPGDDTGRLLNILARKQAKGTFFVVGQRVAQSGRFELRRMVGEGHEIGNHTWDHPDLTTLSPHKVRMELVRTQRVVRRATGVRMRLMRPPYGSTDRVVARQTRRLRLAQILWDVDTFDWRDRNAEVVARRAVRVRPGSIVLMHDIHATTVDAVPEILHRLHAKGYTFVTVSELFGAHTPKPGKEYNNRWRNK